ncbi:MAG: acylphosphatase [Methanothrix sp.]
MLHSSFPPSASVRVQRVGYRAKMLSLARDPGLTGFVQNQLMLIQLSTNTNTSIDSITSLPKARIHAGLTLPLGHGNFLHLGRILSSAPLLCRQIRQS